MSETTSTPQTTRPPDPSGILMALIVALLAPMFLGVAGGDLAYARAAAIQTVNDYRTNNRAGLIAVAQIIAFGLAALGSLSLSLADDISITMALRLRGNANACDRSAENNRRALAKIEAQDPAPEKPEYPEAFPDHSDSDLFLSAAAANLLAEESAARLQPAEPPVSEERRHQEMWAIAMVKESGEITASIPNLPPAQRKAATIRAAMLSSTAHDLIHGTPNRTR